MITILLSFTVSVAFADQCAWVNGPVATDATRRLNTAKVLREWCEPCGEVAPSEPLVVTVAEAVPVAEGAFQVVVNGSKKLDLAYTYVPDTKPGEWVNLGLLSACPAEDISRSWKEPSIPGKTATPAPVASPQPADNH